MTDRMRSWAHAAAGGAIATAGIGLAVVVLVVLPDTPSALALLAGAIASTFVIGLLLWATRSGGPSRAEVGLTGWLAGIAGAARGVLVVLGCGVVVLGAATAIGWLGWELVDPRALIRFFLVTMLMALLFEALPEELAVRGYAFGALRRRLGLDMTVIGTTIVFVVVASILTLLARVAESLLTGAEWAAGEDPLGYLGFIVLLGFVLGYAREATPGNTIGTCIGAHLAVLLVNRLGGFADSATTGIAVTYHHELARFAFPAYLLLALGVFVTLAQRRVEPVNGDS